MTEKCIVFNGPPTLTMLLIQTLNDTKNPIRRKEWRHYMQRCPDKFIINAAAQKNKEPAAKKLVVGSRRGERNTKHYVAVRSVSHVCR